MSLDLREESWLIKATELSVKIKADWWPDDARVSVYVGAHSHSLGGRCIRVTSNVTLRGEQRQLAYSFTELDTPSHSVYLAMVAIIAAHSDGVDDGLSEAKKQMTDTFNKMLSGISR